MKQKKQYNEFTFCFLLFAFLYFIIKKEKVLVNELNINRIENYDIIISEGQSIESKLIRLLKIFNKNYSHSGIIVKNNNKVFVLHSTPDGADANGIRFDSLQTFLNLSDVSDYKVMRYQNISFASRQRLEIEFEKYKSQNAPFDFEFNNYENKRIYCSELIWLIFKNSGLFDINDFNLNEPIYPNYFLKMNKLIVIDLEKNSP